jgi:hypothetical protein
MKHFESDNAVARMECIAAFESLAEKVEEEVAVDEKD